MTLKTDISLTCLALLTGATDLAPITAPHSLSFGNSWTDGVGAGQADLVWGDTRTVTASANDDLDLAGALVGALGTTLTFARIKLIVVTADPGNTNNVVIGGAASAQFVGPFGAATHTHAVKPGGFYATAAPSATGWPVTATTADLLRIANGGAGTSVIYSILLVGASA